jgi:hypothetical protein
MNAKELAGEMKNTYYITSTEIYMLGLEVWRRLLYRLRLSHHLKSNALIEESVSLNFPLHTFLVVYNAVVPLSEYHRSRAYSLKTFSHKLFQRSGPSLIYRTRRFSDERILSRNFECHN